jgi:hypothetical protein
LNGRRNARRINARVPPQKFLRADEAERFRRHGQRMN